jgi:hypothetical protein
LTGMTTTNGNITNFYTGEFSNLGNQALSTGTPIRVVSGMLFNSISGGSVSVDLGGTNTLNNLLLGTDALGNGYGFTGLGQVSTGTLIVNGISNFYGNMSMLGDYILNIANISSNGGAGTSLKVLTPANYVVGGSGITNDSSLMITTNNYIPDVVASCLQYDLHNNPYTQGSPFSLPSQWGSPLTSYTDLTGGNYQVVLARSDLSQQYLQVKIQCSLTFSTIVTGSLAQQYFVYPAISLDTINYIQGISYNPTTPFNLLQYQTTGLTPSQVTSGSVTKTTSATFTIEDTFNLGTGYSLLGSNAIKVGLNVANVDTLLTGGDITSVVLNTQYQWCATPPK